MHTRLRRSAALLVATLLACATPLEAPRDSGELMFWEVESAGSTTRVWLLGSIHVAAPEMQLDPRIVAAFEASDALVLEVDRDAADQAELQKLVSSRAVLPEGQTVESVVPAETWQRLSGFLSSHGMPPEHFQWYEPWFLLTLVTSVLFAESGAAFEAGVDARLARMAGATKEIRGLETVEFQLELLRQVPRRLVVRMLDEILADPERSVRQSALLIEAWELGDLGLLEQAVLGETRDDPDLVDFQERTFFARNRAMAERIDELLAAESEGGTSWFVAVGAGHMAGSEGIPALLEARGHRVRRVPRSVRQ
jgi:uncharacterized protein YbaP (TraB family)